MRKVLYTIFTLLFLVKCSEMEIKWVKKFAPLEDGNYLVNDIQCSEASFYLTGVFWSAEEPGQCIVAKYDTTNEIEWFRIYTKNDFQITRGKSVQVIGGQEIIDEVSANIYIHVVAIEEIGTRRSILAKYNSQGDLLWEKLIECPFDETEEESFMHIDHSNYIYIMGLRKKGSHKYGIFISKYNQSGDKIWYKCHYPQNLSPGQIKFDVKKSGQIVAGGTNALSNDFFYIRFDSLGKLLHFEMSESLEKEHVLADIQIDINYQIYLTGASSDNEGNCDYLTTVFDKNDSLLWKKRFDGPAHLADIPVTISLLQYDSPKPACDVYITGCSHNAEGITEVFTVKYDTAGNEVWAKKFIGKAQESVIPVAICPRFRYYQLFSETENFYITGKAGDDAFIIKHNNNGFITWFTRYADGNINKPVACDGKYIVLQNTVDHQSNTLLIKYGKTEQLGIARWD